MNQRNVKDIPLISTCWIGIITLISAVTFTLILFFQNQQSYILYLIPIFIVLLSTFLVLCKRFKLISSQLVTFQTLIEDMPQIVWMSDVNGKNIYMNHQWEKYFGSPYTDENWANVIHPEDRGLILKKWAESIENNSPLEMEYRVQVVTGGYRWFLVRGNPVRDTNGEVIRWQGTLTDVNTQKVQELEARFSHQELKTVAENIPCSILSIDVDGVILHTSGDHIKKLFDDQELISGSSIYDYSGHTTILSTIANSLQEGVIGQTELSPSPELHYKIHTIPTLDREEAIVGCTLFLLDISEDKRRDSEKAEILSNEKLARETSEFKTKFIANMSHELRTPLNAIMGLTELSLRTHTFDAETERANLQIIHKSANILLDTVNDILDLAKIESNALTLKHQSFSLKEGLESTVEIISYLAKDKGLELNITLPNDLPPHHLGDSYRINQVITNLLANAVKFTEQGFINLIVNYNSLDDDFDLIQFTVKDTGIGIPDELQAHIFSPFMQADDSTTRENCGTGLGLSICKKLIDLMGGEISFETNPGVGTTFNVSIKLKRSDKPMADIKSLDTKTIEKKSDSKKVLLAEDTKINQVVLIRQLETLGHEVTCVENGRLAVEAYKNNDFDIILMDCHMPELNGYDAAVEIRKLEQNTDRFTPIIALTADLLPKRKLQCFESGMNAFVAKPTDIDELAIAISKEYEPPKK